MPERTTEPIDETVAAGILRDGLREAMSRLMSGVVVITTRVGGRPWGATISSCCSLSMDPPLLLVCLANKATTTEAILEQGAFGINILACDQLDVAVRGARPGQPKFIDDEVLDPDGESQAPMIAGALASVHCDLHNALVVGDHTVIVGHVRDVVHGPERAPLAYFGRAFRRLDVAPLISLLHESGDARGNPRRL